MIVKPVFTNVALYHEVFDIVRRVGLLAMAIDIEKCFTVSIVRISVIFLTRLQLSIVDTFLLLVIEFCILLLFDRQILSVNLAAPRHPAITTIAPEVELTVQLMNLMPLMTVHHAGQTEPMSVYRGCKQLVFIDLTHALWNLYSFYLGLLYITRIA